MNVTVQHEISQEQREELRELVGSFNSNLEKTLDSWERTKSTFAYTVVSVGLFTFAIGFLSGRASK